MKNIHIFIILIFNISCSTVNKHEEKKNDKIVIAFQDFFENDTLSLNLNDCQIFEEKKLSSIEEIGYTGVTVRIDNSNNIFLKNTVLKLPCKIELKTKNKLTILFNGNIETFIIDLDKGINIGFNKKEGHLYLVQSKVSFEYD